MISSARSTASFRFSTEQLGERPIRLRLLTIWGTNCAALERKSAGCLVVKNEKQNRVIYRKFGV